MAVQYDFKIKLYVNIEKALWAYLKNVYIFVNTYLHMYLRCIVLRLRMALHHICMFHHRKLPLWRRFCYKDSEHKDQTLINKEKKIILLMKDVQ